MRVTKKSRRSQTPKVAEAKRLSKAKAEERLKLAAQQQTVVDEFKAEVERRLKLAAQQGAIVDEFGRLDALIMPHRANIRRHEDLGKLIRAWHEQSDPESAHALQGEKFEVTVGPKGMQTHIAALEKVMKEMGLPTFLNAASITVKSLEANLPAAQVAALTHKERTGPRTLVVRALTKEEHS